MFNLDSVFSDPDVFENLTAFNPEPSCSKLTMSLVNDSLKF